MVGNSPFVSSWFLFPGPCWGQGLELDNERSGVVCSWLALSPLLLRDPHWWHSPCPHNFDSYSPTSKKAEDLRGTVMLEEHCVPACGLLGGARRYQPYGSCWLASQSFGLIFQTPQKLRIPISHYELFTKVHRDRKQGCPVVLLLVHDYVFILHLSLIQRTGYNQHFKVCR